LKSSNAKNQYIVTHKTLLILETGVQMIVHKGGAADTIATAHSLGSVGKFIISSLVL
jgi:hypothetical protein